MKRASWLKLALAPLLLAASLLSAPLGSMEQTRADAVERADASSLPAARLAPGGPVARPPVAPRRLDHPLFHLAAHLSAAPGQVDVPGSAVLAARPRRTDFRVPPVCERPPHHALPPPSLG